MAGTIEGGRKASTTNRKLWGEDFYVRIGAMGGKAGRGHQFAHGKVSPVEAGRKGGSASRRGRARNVAND